MEDKSVEELCAAFDKIINSDNESVKRAFRHLLTLAELTDSHHEEDTALVSLGIRSPGPFTGLLRRLDKLEQEIQKVKIGSSRTSIDTGSYTMAGSGLTIGAGIPSITLTGLAVTDTISLGDYASGTDTIIFTDVDHKPFDNKP